MTSTRISVVIPTYNRVYTLERAIQSVFAQTFQDFELIVVDDASTDGTREYLGKLASSGNPKLRVFQQGENRGVSTARNIGIENSHGQWIAFLDSDDEWLPEKLSAQMAAVETLKTQSSASEVRLIHTDEVWIRDGVRVNQKNKHAKSGGRVFNRCVDLCFIAPSSVLIRKDLFADLGFFREDFPVCEDYELWLRVSAGEEIHFMDETLIYKYGGHEDQLSRTVAMDLWRVRALLPFLIRDFRGDFYASPSSPTAPSALLPVSSKHNSRVQDLLSGTENDFYSLISEDERKHAHENVLHRLSVLRKGATKHENFMLQKQIAEIETWLAHL